MNTSVDHNDANENQNDDAITSSIIRCQLANDTCQAMENGNISKLYSILDIDTGETTLSPAASSGGDYDDETNNTPSSSSATQKCQEVLSIFYSLIGYYNKEDETESSYTNNGLEEEFPLSVKAHLLLRGLLRIPHDKYLIPW